MTNFSSLLLLSGLALASIAQAQNFAPAVNYPTGSAATTRVGLVIADVNSDTHPDLVVASYYPVGIAVLLGNGNGTFQAPIAVPPYAAAPMLSDIAVADITGDGKADIVMADVGPNAVEVLPGNNDGTFQLPTAATIFSVGGSPFSVAISDINQDGRPDIATSNLNGKVGVVLSTGTGTFQPVVNHAVATPQGMVADLLLSDFNHDGKPDVAVSRSDATASVLLGSAGGGFQVANDYSTTCAAYHGAVADMNNDGNPDLLAVCNADKIGLLLGNGNGTFQPVTSYLLNAGSRPTDLTVADLTGDGKPDWILANNGIHTVSILPNTGNGTFSTGSSYSTGAGSSPYAVALADLNGDGLLDIVTNNNTGTVSVLLSTSTPLAARATLPGTSATLHPNPTSTSTALTVVGLPATTAQVQATLLDATGRTVGQQQLAATQGTAHAEVPTAGLAAGLYVLRLTAHDAQGQPIGSLPSQRLGVQ